METIDTIKYRKSTRRFSNKKISDSQIKNILRYGLYAPTPCNQQLWKFIVIKNDKIKDILVKEAFSSTLIRRAPVVVVITYDGWNYKEAIQASSMAVQNILLAATDLDIGCLAMNSYGADSKIKKILNIPDHYEICCFVCLGHKAKSEQVSRPIPKKQIDDIVSFDRATNMPDITYSYNPNNWTFQNLLEYQKYYCRKTFLGKEMDINHPLEREIVKKHLKDAKGPIFDFLSYDGSYLDLFPNEKIISTDICEETSKYTQAAPNEKDVSFEIFDRNKIKLTDKKVNTITLIFKAERLSKKELNQILKKAYKTLSENGKLIIVYRKNNFFFNVFYKTIKLMFGDDIRKTGIYAFFGPYEPLKTKKLEIQFKKIGFSKVQSKNYFFFPPFLDQAAQMYLQFKRSEGSSYLHRNRINNFLSKFISTILKYQGIRKNKFGSIGVLEVSK